MIWISVLCYEFLWCLGLTPFQYLQENVIYTSSLGINKYSVLFSRILPHSIRLVLVVSLHHSSCLWWLFLSFTFKQHTHQHTRMQICTYSNLHTSSFAHLHALVHLNALVLYSPLPLSFWELNFQPNFQQKCATLSPSAAVVTLSYSEMQSNFLVQD